MARPREFDEDEVLDAAVARFWRDGYEGTSMRDLIAGTGLTSASLYNAFGDKRALYRRALDRYVDRSVTDRIRRCERLAPRAAIAAFFAEVLQRSLTDAECRGCMLVNSALEATPRDPELRRAIADELGRIEAFFLGRVRAGQAEGAITRTLAAEDLARNLLGVLMGLRVLARVRPEPALLEGMVRAALELPVADRPAAAADAG